MGIQLAGPEVEWEALIAQPDCWATNTPPEYLSETRFGKTQSQRPVDYDGDSVIVNSERMEPGPLYSFLFAGHVLIVKKSRDGTLDFFRLKEPPTG